MKNKTKRWKHQKDVDSGRSYEVVFVEIDLFERQWTKTGMIEMKGRPKVFEPMMFLVLNDQIKFSKNVCCHTVCLQDYLPVKYGV